MNDKTLKIPVTTERTFITLQKWIDTVAASPERHDLGAWMFQAEQSACDARENDDISIEMRGFCTISGNPEVLILDRSVFDWLEIED